MENHAKCCYVIELSPVMWRKKAFGNFVLIHESVVLKRLWVFGSNWNKIYEVIGLIGANQVVLLLRCSSDRKAN